MPTGPSTDCGLTPRTPGRHGESSQRHAVDHPPIYSPRATVVPGASPSDPAVVTEAAGATDGDALADGVPDDGRRPTQWVAGGHPGSHLAERVGDFGAPR
jgi:hypothetical protein